MLIEVDLLERYWGIKPQRIVHIGAHEGEELDAYLAADWGTLGVTWVEAMPNKAQELATRLKERGLDNHVVINVLAWDSTGELQTFFVTNNGQSSSALEFAEHSRLYPQITVSHEMQLEGRRFCDAVDNPYQPIDLLNLDVQGVELRVLLGFGDILAQVDAIYSEVNVTEIYRGCSLFHEVNEWLGHQGFELIDWHVLRAGWGDALWLRSSNNVARLPRMRRALRRLHTHMRTLYRRSRKAIDAILPR